MVVLSPPTHLRSSFASGKCETITTYFLKKKKTFPFCYDPLSSKSFSTIDSFYMLKEEITRCKTKKIQRGSRKYSKVIIYKKKNKEFQAQIYV